MSNDDSFAGYNGLSVKPKAKADLRSAEVNKIQSAMIDSRKPQASPSIYMGGKGSGKSSIIAMLDKQGLTGRVITTMMQGRPTAGSLYLMDVKPNK